jgi:hypothetical protein
LYDYNDNLGFANLDKNYPEEAYDYSHFDEYNQPEAERVSQPTVPTESQASGE